MGAAQQERKQRARSARAQARGSGYLDGLYGVEARAGLYHPNYRFAYAAGHRDGMRARDESMKGE